MSTVPGRALHYVFKIGDRAKNAFFFQTILGMQVYRHEEFTEGCEAECNGPYDNRWSKTMIGYGPESSNFVFELTYNYGVKHYEMGNDFGGVTIHSKEVLAKAVEHSYPVVKQGENNILVSPDGYKFYVVEVAPSSSLSDPVQQVELHVKDLAVSRKYWHELLKMNLVEENEKSVLLTYGTNQTLLRLTLLTEALDRAKAYGRIAFEIPGSTQQSLFEAVKTAGGNILKRVQLDTPGKATVSVIILADPNGHEICFVDKEGFTELSQPDATAGDQLEKYIRKDPFQDKEQS
ncbi:hypothetical protein KR044_002190 [Drosophila immigrans]|nr:hypothetical protein KR044_002190 [Drosophila immigrans]